MSFKHLATLAMFSLALGSQSLKAGNLGVLTYEINGETVTITEISYGASGAVIIPSLIEGKPVTRIGIYACYSRNSITSLTLPSSLKRIDASAFAICRRLVTCNLPEGIQVIDDGAFSTCSSLKQITIPSTVTHLGTDLFGSCQNLQSVELPKNLTEIPDSMFSGCQNLQSVELPENLTKIPDRIFSGCQSLKTLRIPPQVKSIGSYAFITSGLTKLTIPASVTSLGTAALEACRELEQVVFEGGLSRIEAYTFASCSSLSRIKLPANVTYIGVSAFAETPISKINLKRVETIGPMAFKGCNRLLTVLFPRTLKTLDTQSFSSCGNLASAVFTGDAPKIGEQVFAGSTPEFKIFLSDKSRGFTLNRWMGYKTSLPAGEIHIQSSEGSILEEGGKVQFGSLLTGKKGPLKTFAITNVGNLPLTDISTSLDSGDTADYKIIIPLKTRLAPGANTQLGLRFSPKKRGKRTSTLVISSSDKNENPFAINLVGRGLFLLK